MKAKPIKSFDYAYKQYYRLLEKYNSTQDARKKVVLFKELVKLLAAMEFFINIQ